MTKVMTSSEARNALRELENEMEELYEVGRDLIQNYLDAVEREAYASDVDPACALVGVPGFLDGHLTDYPWVVGLNKTLSAELRQRVQRYAHGAGVRKWVLENAKGNMR